MKEKNITLIFIILIIKDITKLWAEEAISVKVKLLKNVANNLKYFMKKKFEIYNKCF